jgi:hypothetical protein
MMRWAPTIVVVLLLGGTAIAFATAERQKLEKTPFAVVHVDEAISPMHGPAAVSLRFRRSHLLTLQIVDKDDRVVATLARERRVEPGLDTFRWPARSAPDGVYRPKVTLDAGREFILQSPITVDTVAPTTKLISYSPRVVRRHRPKARVRITYQLSEPGHVRVFVNGRKVQEGGGTKPRFQLDWHPKGLRAGRYRLQLAAVDLVGNVGARTQPFVVRVRK